MSAKFVSEICNEYAKDLSCESVVMTRRGVGTKPNQGTAACPPATLDSQTPSTPLAHPAPRLIDILDIPKHTETLHRSFPN